MKTPTRSMSEGVVVAARQNQQRSLTRPSLTLRVSVLAALALLLEGRQAAGQASWEYTPYQVHVRLAIEPVAQLPDNVLETLAESIAFRSQSVLGAVWQPETALAAPKLRDEALRGIASLSPEAVAAAADARDLSADKLYVVALSRRDELLHVAVRELDCRTRQLGPLIERSAPNLAALPSALWDALLESFTPLARIEQLEERQVTARLRAGGLIVDEDSGALVEPGMALRPVVRRNDKNGQPLKGGVQAPPFTLLSVAERRESILDCTLDSGYRNPLPTRGGVRMERLALLVKPRHAGTKLLLRSRTDAKKPLAGYEIYMREIHTRETSASEGEGDQMRLVGVTDAAGAVELPSAGHSAQLFVIKSGKQLLARLPIVPGEDETLTARVVDDDARLLAEAYTAALTSRALDLVARRQIFATRIRARLKDGKTADAQRLLDDFRKLETAADLSRDLDRYRLQVAAADKLTQSRIDRLFTETRQVLRLKPLSDELLTDLSREVSAGRAGSE